MAYLVGRGLSDITGEPADAGMMGYGKAEQRSSGIHTRLRSRAFVFEHDGNRILLIVNDLPLVFESIHRAVLDRLEARYGDLYNDRNTMITATHTHCGPGGYSHHYVYNATTDGFRRKTFDAIVDGMVEAVERADADIAPSTLTLAHGELRNASANRSPIAFERNPKADKKFFPGGVDSQTTLLAIERDDRLVGAVSWFATHNTSMTNTNTLISSDNKGYAAYHWERLTEGVDYRSQDDPHFIAAFAQTNAGDMSPNLNLSPGSGPTENEVENTRIIGLRQYDSVTKLLAEPPVSVSGSIDYRLIYVGRTRAAMAYLDELIALHGDRLDVHVGDENTSLDVRRLVATLEPDTELYQCGPIRLMDAVRREWIERELPIASLRFETFGNSGWFEPQEFTVRLPQFGIETVVGPTQSMLEALEAAGADMMFDCRKGECGLCEVRVLELEGEIDHRDVFYSERQRDARSKLCCCVSRVARPQRGAVVTISSS